MMDTTKNYQQWLREFTEHAATVSVAVDAEGHADVLDLYWRESKPLSDVLHQYVKFSRRWNALQQHWY